jgi:hypothetical protein
MKTEMLKQFIKSAHRFIQNDFKCVSEKQFDERIEICNHCPEWDAQALNATGRCRKCGCSTWAKLRMATERCPLGKWGAVDKPTN